MEMNTNLEMLTAREQLMEDIDCIIESNLKSTNLCGISYTNL